MKRFFTSTILFCLSIALNACAIDDEEYSSEHYAAACVDPNGDGFGWDGQASCNPNHLNPTGDRPVVYLTFDDGPSRDESTQRIRSALSRYGAKATFFVTGKAAENNPGMLAALVADGHAIGSHSFNHESYRNMSSSAMRSDLNRTQQAVHQAGGPTMTCYRPPFGATNPTIRQHAANVGLGEVLWDIGTRDFISSLPAWEIRQAMDQVRNGDIVLLHDGEVGKINTVLAVERWLADNHTRYEFRRVPSCSTSSGTPTRTRTIQAQRQPAQQGVCSSAAADPDGDGWGWENGASCVVSETSSNTPSTGSSSTAPACSSSSADPDGDGWGYENGRSCVVNSASNNNSGNGNASSSKPTCSSASADPDGDGFGWENGQSCVVSSSGSNNGTSSSSSSGGRSAYPSCSSSSVDPDGDGFGWENGETCVVN